MSTELKNVNILYVEDDDFIREQTSGLLEIIFNKVYTAEDGKEGVVAYTKHDAELDAVITDINMPELSGIEMAKKINELNKKYPRTPIIAVSAYSKDDYAITDLQGNFAHYISKPIKIKDLVECVQSALEGKTQDYTAK